MTKTERKLAHQLRRTVEELERLHYLLVPQFEGKVGEPDKTIIRNARKVLVSTSL